LESLLRAPRQYTVCRALVLEAVKTELPGKVTAEEMKKMQRDLVVQLWSCKPWLWSIKGTGVSGPLSKWESAAAVI
jgi:hypothetical protein